MAVKIYEKYPDGANSFKYIMDRLETNFKKSNNLKDVWNVLEPEIKDAMRYTFSTANPSKWNKIDSRYRAWKVKHGYPHITGVLTGALKMSVTDRAVVKKHNKKMEYQVNENVRSKLTHTIHAKNKNVGDYAKYYNKKRPIFVWAKKYINDKVRKTVAAYIASQTKTVEVKD